MPSWIVWLLVVGNLVNLAFDGTIIVVRSVRWFQRRAYEKRRGVIRHAR